MRLVQVTVPTGKREAVLSALDEEGIDYVVSDETSGREFSAVVMFPVPTAAVEPVLESLREAGIEREAYTVVLDAETVVSERFESLAEEYAENVDEDRIAREELVARARDLAPGTLTFYMLTVVSVVIATAGVLLDSPAVVVGSMVIAPLIGPAMATSVGTVVDDPDLFRRGVKLQLSGFAVAVVAATAFAVLVKTIALVPPGLDVLSIAEVQERVTPDFLSLVVALGAGVAGAHSLRSGVSASLVGVMIAVALVPPFAVIGIGIAWGLPVVVVGSTVLVAVNALSINLAALVTLWYSGYRPERWFRLDEARSATLTRVGTLLMTLLVLSVFLGGVTYVSYRQAVTEDAIREEVHDVVDSNGDLRVLDVSVEFESIDRALLGNPLDPPVEEVTVTLGHAPGDPPPDVADVLAARLEAAGHPEATVEVHYVAVGTAGGPRASIDAAVSGRPAPRMHPTG